MKKILFTIATIVFFAPILSFAQNGGSGYQKRLWKKYRWELVMGLGTSHLLGDLGGGDGPAGRFMDVREMNMAKTRPVFHVGMRYKIFERIAFKGAITYAMLSAADEESGELTRQMRNLSVFNHLWEFSGQLEFSIIKENRGKRYIFQKNSIINNMNLYIFGGIAGIHFNPYNEMGGTELQPLGTEGQGQDGYDDKYSLWSVSIPVGIGFKYYLSKKWSIGLEISNRYSMTDYLDDVSGNYYNPATDMGAEFYEVSDPNIWGGTSANGALDGNDRFRSGDRRGSSDYNDAYVFMIFNLTYTLETGARGGPKFGFF